MFSFTSVFINPRIVYHRNQRKKTKIVDIKKISSDDIPDFEIMSHCGVAACPADAAQEIKEISDYISLYAGGRGCVRDIIEQVLRLQGKWFHSDAVEW